jgi:hypothetical protein
VAPEGRFLMLRREVQGANLRIVLNWTEERPFHLYGGVGLTYPALLEAGPAKGLESKSALP